MLEQASTSDAIYQLQMGDYWTDWFACNELWIIIIIIEIQDVCDVRTISSWMCLSVW